MKQHNFTANIKEFVRKKSATAAIIASINNRSKYRNLFLRFKGDNIFIEYYPKGGIL